MPLTTKAQQLPKSLQNVISLSIQLLDPKQILLFGSRARNTHRDTSDFDLAFRGLAKPGEWARFQAEVGEQPLTLHKLDLLVYETTSEAYRKNIDAEGVVLYER